MAKTNGTLDMHALELWLWEAACTIRGPLDAPRFKAYILPLIFLKRLSDVFEDEIAHLANELGDEKTAATLAEQDHMLTLLANSPKRPMRTILEHNRGHWV